MITLALIGNSVGIPTGFDSSCRCLNQHWSLLNHSGGSCPPSYALNPSLIQLNIGLNLALCRGKRGACPVIRSSDVSRLNAPYAL